MTGKQNSEADELLCGGQHLLRKLPSGRQVGNDRFCDASTDRRGFFKRTLAHLLVGDTFGSEFRLEARAWPIKSGSHEKRYARCKAEERQGRGSSGIVEAELEMEGVPGARRAGLPERERTRVRVAGVRRGRLLLEYDGDAELRRHRRAQRRRWRAGGPLLARLERGDRRNRGGRRESVRGDAVPYC